MTPTPPRPLLTVVEVPLADLRPDPDNPRRITAKRRAILEQQVADDSFMRARPVIALPDGLIVAGEQRWRARAKIGRETCFAFFADLDDAERVEWAARDNNHAGEWVGDALGELLGDERRPDRLALMGFTLDDVDKLVRPAKRDRGSAAGSDDLPDLPEEPETRPGDVIELGAHRLICGDATKDGVLDRLLARGASGPGAARVDAVITDPPYAIYGSSTGLAAEVADDKMVRPFFRAAAAARLDGREVSDLHRRARRGLHRRPVPPAPARLRDPRRQRPPARPRARLRRRRDRRRDLARARHRRRSDRRGRARRQGHRRREGLARHPRPPAAPLRPVRSVATRQATTRRLRRASPTREPDRSAPVTDIGPVREIIRVEPLRDPFAPAPERDEPAAPPAEPEPAREPEEVPA